VSWHGNSCSVPPGHAGQQVTVRHQLGTATIGIVTAAGTVLARHHREPDHAGAVIRAEEHAAALEARVLAARGAGAVPCHRKDRRPPSPAARAEAAVILAANPGRALPSPASPATPPPRARCGPPAGTTPVTTKGEPDHDHHQRGRPDQ